MTSDPFSTGTWRCPTVFRKNENKAFSSSTKCCCCVRLVPLTTKGCPERTSFLASIVEMGSGKIRSSQTDAGTTDDSKHDLRRSWIICSHDPLIAQKIYCMTCATCQIFTELWYDSSTRMLGNQMLSLKSTIAFLPSIVPYDNDDDSTDHTRFQSGLSFVNLI